MRKNRFATVAALSLSIALGSAVTARAQVQPGDVISPSNASKVENLVSPGNFALVKQGMTMKITPSTHLDWPPPYKAATEQYSAQVSLTPDGELKNYVAVCRSRWSTPTIRRRLRRLCGTSPSGRSTPTTSTLATPRR